MASTSTRLAPAVAFRAEVAGRGGPTSRLLGRSDGRLAAGFSLIELLVVVSIIAVLAALLLPTMRTSHGHTAGPNGPDLKGSNQLYGDCSVPWKTAAACNGASLRDDWASASAFMERCPEIRWHLLLMAVSLQSIQRFFSDDVTV